MKKTEKLQIRMDDEGHLVLPYELIDAYGLESGALVSIQHTENGFWLSRSTASLAKVYIEITNVCNLNWSTCMRNVSHESLGMMDMPTFERILESIKMLHPRPLVFIGGYGEPLAHPNFLEMVTALRNEDFQVEFITNGTQLTDQMIDKLIDLNAQRIWVSIDGATPARYADIRLGDSLPQVLDNLSLLQRLKQMKSRSRPRLGIAFVAMQRNLNDLPAVVRIGKNLGADLFSVSNLLPHTPEQRKEILYQRLMYSMEMQPSRWSPEVMLPRFDLNNTTLGILDQIIKGNNNLSIARQPIKSAANSCPFIEKGSVSIRWDGAVSPCLPLLHTHQNYLDNTLRVNHAYSVGSIHDRDLLDLWKDPVYVKLREKLKAFDFSFCTYCNSCDMAEANLEDCFGSDHPACGGCLWAQGFIQCP